MQYAYFKAVRRSILEALYQSWCADPLATLTPEELLSRTELVKDDLAVNIHYLGDRGLVELMLGYTPPLFTAARIRPAGVDLVENPFEFNRQFPPVPEHEDADLARLPVLVEQLVAQVDLAQVSGATRRRMLRDVQYLRDEVSRRPDEWRLGVVDSVATWIRGELRDPDDVLPALDDIVALVREFDSREKG